MSSRTKKRAVEKAPEKQPAGYQPSFGRKLFMLGLCIVGLIVVWVYYFHLQGSETGSKTAAPAGSSQSK
jgi:hypothetical protein